MREAIVETRGSGEPYQTVVRFGASGPRIHIFWRGDVDLDCHDHPADFWTFPLTSYLESVREPSGRQVYRVVRAFRLYRRGAEYAHRVVGRWQPGRVQLVIDEPIVTLVWWGKKRRCANGQPGHPLYIGYEEPFLPWPRP